MNLLTALVIIKAFKHFTLNVQLCSCTTLSESFIRDTFKINNCRYDDINGIVKQRTRYFIIKQYKEIQISC